jgi:predicted DNA-binding protein (MmcQ/YjbR family)
MAARNSLAQAESALRETAMAYPEATEEFPWGHRAIKVRGKVFVFLHLIDGVLTMGVKLPVSNELALALPFATPTEYGLGKSGWVTARFGAKDPVPVEMLSEWIDESFRAVAPKKVLAALESAEDAAAPRARERKQGAGQ